MSIGKSFLQYLNESEFPGLVGYSINDIKDIVADWIRERISDYWLDIDVLGMYVHGSRIRGDFRPDSDLDVVLYYRGSLKEDYVFDMFHEDPVLKINGIEVDINPIRDQETGNLESYIERDRKYDKMKSNKSPKNGL